MSDEGWRLGKEVLMPQFCGFMNGCNGGLVTK